jgi:hypothetical protein
MFSASIRSLVRKNFILTASHVCRPISNFLEQFLNLFGRKILTIWQQCAKFHFPGIWPSIISTSSSSSLPTLSRRPRSSGWSSAPHSSIGWPWGRWTSFSASWSSPWDGQPLTPCASSAAPSLSSRCSLSVTLT